MGLLVLKLPTESPFCMQGRVGLLSCHGGPARVSKGVGTKFKRGGGREPGAGSLIPLMLNRDLLGDCPRSRQTHMISPNVFCKHTVGTQ